MEKRIITPDLQKFLDGKLIIAIRSQDSCYNLTQHLKSCGVKPVNAIKHSTTYPAYYNSDFPYYYMDNLRMYADTSISALSRKTLVKEYEDLDFVKWPHKDSLDFISQVDTNALLPFAKDLCRAKRLDTGKWVQGFIIRDEQDTDKCFIGYVDGTNSDNTPHDFDITAVDPSTICHCIGLTDNNKQMIFEKDVVEFVSSSKKSEKYLYLLWWNNEMQCMTAVDMGNIYFNGYDYNDGNQNLRMISYDTFCLMMQDPYGDFRDIKVVGNIIDDIELLGNLKVYGKR